MNRKKIIIIVLVVLLFVGFIILIMALNHKKTNVTQEPEKAAQIQIQLAGGDKLYSVVSNEEYLAIKEELSNYAKTKGGDPTGVAKIVGTPYVDPANGYIVHFSVLFKDINKQIDATATITRSGDLIFFEIPAEKIKTIHELTY